MHSLCCAAGQSALTDYGCSCQVLHLLLCQLSGKSVDPTLWDFLCVDEQLVDIGDDLVDYEVHSTS